MQEADNYQNVTQTDNILSKTWLLLQVARKNFVAIVTWLLKTNLSKLTDAI